MKISEMIRKHVQVNHSLRSVSIEISGSQETIILLNTIMIGWLAVLKHEEMVRCIADKQDVIVLYPQRSVTVQELLVDVKRIVYGVNGLVEVGAVC